MTSATSFYSFHYLRYHYNTVTAEDIAGCLVIIVVVVFIRLVVFVDFVVIVRYVADL
jgi:hypothetical protein